MELFMPTENTQAVIVRLENGRWLSDGGLETTLIFHDGIDLPHFASFPLLSQEAGRQALSRYFGRYLAEARRFGAGFLMDTATWRAGAGWGAIMGLSPEEIDAVNRDAVDFARRLAAMPEARGIDILLNGVIGPHGDAYAPDRLLEAHEAQDVHARQVRVLAAA